MGIWSSQPIPALSGVTTTHQVDLSVWIDKLPTALQTLSHDAHCWYASVDQDEHNQPLLTIWWSANSRTFRLCYSDGIEFAVDQQGRQVWVKWPATTTLEEAIIYLLGQVIGFVLWLRGVLCFHASAVAIDGRAVMLVGPSGAGKSSTAATFAHQGYRILTDDIVALTEQDGQFFVQPAHPHLRLWSETVGALYGDRDALPWLTPTWDKRCLDLVAHKDAFQPEPLPLAAIYLLSDRRDEPAAPFVQSLPRNEGLLHLIANVYAATLPDKTRRARNFATISQIAARLPLRQVIAHKNLATLPRLCDVIAQDFRSLVQ